MHNTTKLYVQASFWILNTSDSETFIVEPMSMLLEPGQKQVAPLYHFRQWGRALSVFLFDGLLISAEKHQLYFVAGNL